MKKSYRFLFSILAVGAYVLSACSGVVPQSGDPQQNAGGSSQSTAAVFTGTVEATGGTIWLISGQQVNVDDSTTIEPNIQVGDIVKVEASVSADGVVVALKIESSGPDAGNANDNAANDNSSNGNDSNANDDNGNLNDNSANDNANVDDNSNSASSEMEQETFGMVEAITDTTITIGGITYTLADFTEFNDLIAVGDQVKIHVIVNDDGTLTIREIERSTGTGIGNDNGNSNDDNSNYNGNSNDDNSNKNSNDDDHNNSNSNDDGNDDDSGGSNSNDD